MVGAATIRERHPATGVLVLSSTSRPATPCSWSSSDGGFGYLLKDRVLDVDDFLEACSRVARGHRSRRRGGGRPGRAADRGGPLADLTPREREVLALMAEGRTNAGIAQRLWLTEKTVETHVRAILRKLGLAAGVEDHRRVLAVLTYLRAGAAGGSAN